MMAGADELREIARQAFEDAHTHRDEDLAAARTPAEAKAVIDNHDRALAQYLESLRAAFDGGSPAWTAALAAARQAQADVAKARADAEALPARLQALSTLTQSVASLLTAAGA